MQASPVQAVVPLARAVDARDWVAWYEELQPGERRELRARLIEAPYDEVKGDAELRQFFFFHMEDLVDEQPPGTARLCELHHVVQMLRGAAEPEQVEQRRKAMAFLLAEYQRFLRDNPWSA